MNIVYPEVGNRDSMKLCSSPLRGMLKVVVIITNCFSLAKLTIHSHASCLTNSLMLGKLSQRDIGVKECLPGKTVNDKNYGFAQMLYAEFLECRIRAIRCHISDVTFLISQNLSVQFTFIFAFISLTYAMRFIIFLDAHC